MAETPVQYYNTASEQQNIKFKWWASEEGENLSRHVFGVVNRITENQKYRELSDVRYARLYHNMELVSLRAGMFARSAGQDNRMANRVTLNVTKSCIDTVRAKISKSKPRPMFLTADGSWSVQQKAKLLTKYVAGLFEYRDVYATGQFNCLDACVFGLGAMYVFVGPDGQIDFERVMPIELVVDETEGRYQAPRQIHRVKLVFREVLKDLFPEYEKHIEAAGSGLTVEESQNCSADMLKVIESWHLPSGIGASDGRHCINIDNCTLFDEPYTRDYFPFAFLRWTPKLLGFMGMGLAEELIGIQLEINKLLRNIQISQHLMAVPQIWVEANSHVVTAHLNNEIGGVKKYVGSPPIFMVPQAMSPEVYQYLESLVRKAYEITGISMLSASSVKPAGVTAAVAMREYQDIESERFVLFGQSYERLFIDAAKIAIDMTRDQYEKDPSLAIKAKDGKFMRQIKWRDVDLADDMYTMSVFPTALLPSTPAGKLQKTQELLQAGFIDKEEALSLLDFPDTDKVTSLKTAARENIMKMVDLMVNEGRYTSPEPFMNLQLALQVAQNTYNEAQMNNVDEDRLELLRRFMDDVQSLLTPDQSQQVQMGATPDMMAAGLPGQAVPQAPPVSDLLPFAGQQAPGMVPGA